MVTCRFHSFDDKFLDEIKLCKVSYSPGRKYFNFSFILSLSKTVKPKVIIVLSYIKESHFLLILSTLSTGWSFLWPILGQINSNVHYVIFWMIFIYVFIIIQATVTMNKVKTIDKVNLRMMIKSREELNHM